MLAAALALGIPTAAAHTPTITVSLNADKDIVVTWSLPPQDEALFVDYASERLTHSDGSAYCRPPYHPTVEALSWNRARDGGVEVVQGRTEVVIDELDSYERDRTYYVQLDLYGPPDNPPYPDYKCHHFSNIASIFVPSRGGGGPPPPPSGEPLDFGSIGQIKSATVGHPYRYGFCKVAIAGVPVGTKGLPKGRLCMDSPSNPRFNVLDPSGGTQPYSFRLKIGGGHPPRGLKLNTNTGYLEGVPEPGTNRVGRPRGVHRFIVCAYSRDNLHQGVFRRVTLRVSCPLYFRIVRGNCVPKKRSRRAASAGDAIAPLVTFLARSFKGLF